MELAVDDLVKTYAELGKFKLELTCGGHSDKFYTFQMCLQTLRMEGEGDSWLVIWPLQNTECGI